MVEPIELSSNGVAMKKDGLAMEAEGVLVQKRQVSPVMVERGKSILVWSFYGFLRLFDPFY